MPSNIRGTDNFDSAEVIGQNQTWVDVLASRVNDTPYVNDTGRPIMVNIGVFGDGSPSSLNLTVDGVLVSEARDGSTAAGGRGTLSVIVPNGSTYVVASDDDDNASFWAELR